MQSEAAVPSRRERTFKIGRWSRDRRYTRDCDDHLGTHHPDPIACCMNYFVSLLYKIVNKSNTGKGDFFWFKFKTTDNHSGEIMVAGAGHKTPSVRKQQCMLFSPFYSVSDLTPGDGTSHIKCGSS